MLFPSVQGELEAQLPNSWVPSSGFSLATVFSQMTFPSFLLIMKILNSWTKSVRLTGIGLAGFCAEVSIAAFSWVGTAVVTMILSSQITGVEWPLPGISLFHFRFLDSPNSTGGLPFRAAPVNNGPRHWGQLLRAGGWAVTELTADIENATKKEKMRNVPIDKMFYDSGG
jgi:hypothetical protein